MFARYIQEQAIEKRAASVPHICYFWCFAGEMGIDMLRLMQLRLAAAGLFAAGILSLTVASAWAFSQETLSPNSGGGNYNFGDPDKQIADPDNSNSGQGTRPFGSNGPTLQFGVQQNPSAVFGRSNGYNSTPDLYFRQLNGN